MKKKTLLLALFILICSLAFAIGCAQTGERFSVTFVIDNEQVQTESYNKNQYASAPDISIEEGYSLKGWFTDDKLTEKWDFSERKITDNIVLYATRLKDYQIVFIAENKKVASFKFNSDTQSINEPAVPDKPYYNGVWESYELTDNDLEVKAVYTPITYTAVFKADEEIVSQFKYTVEDTVKIPAVPQKVGYTAEWAGLPLVGGNTTVTAHYTPITYTITFKAGNETIDTCEYNIENKAITPPQVPKRDGYSGKWADFELTIGNITVNAEYSLITYTATFANGSNIISVQNFNAENMLLYEPAVPLAEKTGYTTRWEEYELKYEDIIIRPVYAPITYTAQFIANEVILSTIKFTIENQELNAPDIPPRPGYTSEWEHFEIKAENLIIHPVYTPITYYATFMCETTEVAKLPFTVETIKLDEPAPILKSGHIVKWSEYVLGSENITVTAIYTEILKDEFTYEQLPGGTLKVTGYTGEDKSIVIPSDHEGTPISTIGELAFNSSLITSLTIGYGIKAIEKEAFLNCTQLTYVELPESLQSIGENAFAFCGMQQLTIPDSVISIGKWAFAHSKLKSIKLSDKLETLIDIFYNCEELDSVTLGKGLKTICTNAFNLCKSLKRIKLPSSVCEIQPGSFKDGDFITEIYFEDKANWYFYSDGIQLGELESERLDTPTDAAYICKQTNNSLIKLTERD